MSIEKKFKDMCTQEIIAQGNTPAITDLTKKWISHPVTRKYSYHFTWLGRPIIQYPQDIVAMQEIIFSVQPDLIIETGIAHGGSLILYASLLELNAIMGGPKNAHVLGIDIDIRQHNRLAIEAHPMCAQKKRITMIEGSSIKPEIITAVQNISHQYKNIMVLLDSNHTHDHVLQELNAYAPLVTKGSYCIVFDTIIEHMPQGSYPERDWDIGNNPQTAVTSYLANHPEFSIDKSIDAKLLISVAPKGYLQRIS